VAAGGLIFLNVFYHSSMFIANTSAYQMGWVGFYAGVAGAAALAGLYRYGWSYLNVGIEASFKFALAEITRDKTVARRLGSKLRPGVMRTFAVDGGGFGLSGQYKRLQYEPRRVQLMFQLVGNNAQGVVSAEVTKLKGQLALNLLRIEVVGDSHDVITLVGGEDHQLPIRNYITFNKNYLLDRRV